MKTAEARRKIEIEADKLIEAVKELPDAIRPPYLNLLDQLEATHPSSVAASMVRDGDWHSFNVASILGLGLRIDANKRTEHHLTRIEIKLEEFEKDHSELRDVIQSVEALRAGVAEARQDFLASARHIGADAYGALVTKNRKVLDRAEARYGEGAGYKQDVAGYWRDFFEAGDGPQLETRRAVNKRLQSAWEQTILERLRLGTRVEKEGEAD